MSKKKFMEEQQKRQLQTKETADIINKNVQATRKHKICELCKKIKCQSNENNDDLEYIPPIDTTQIEAFNIQNNKFYKIILLILILLILFNS